MRMCTIIGARPQFIKAAAVSTAALEDDRVKEIIIHTGQHYDEAMSKVFFDQLGIPKESHNLEIGSGSHGAQTGRMLERLDVVLSAEQPDVVLIYGDTNSTLAGALAAAKLHIPVAHVEAGMRSFNRRMPEEINRVVADHVADVNFCSTESAVKHLTDEGLGDTAIWVGDVMLDCVLAFSDAASAGSLSVEAPDEFFLLTCHRAENTESPERMRAIIQAVNTLAEQTPVVYPAHPRTPTKLTEYGLTFSDNVRVIQPVGYLEMLHLEKRAKLILTDSGGVQKEAMFLQTPCVTMRDETEWTETVNAGWNVVAGAETERILQAVASFENGAPSSIDLKPYGEGNAARRVIDELVQRFDPDSTH